MGPETWRYRDMVEAIGAAIGKPRRLVRLPRWLGLAFATLLGWCVRDVVLTRAEIDAFRDGLLHTSSPPSSPTRLSAWLERYGHDLGRTYANELTRRRRRDVAYAAAACAAPRVAANRPPIAS
jgi:NADH dehydrogenase